jgi:hypothetical protein
MAITDLTRGSRNESPPALFIPAIASAGVTG